MHVQGAEFQGHCYPRQNKNSCFRRQLSAVHKSASQNSLQWTYKYLDQWNIWPEFLDRVNNLEYFITCLGTGRSVQNSQRAEKSQKRKLLINILFSKVTVIWKVLGFRTI